MPHIPHLQLQEQPPQKREKRKLSDAHQEPVHGQFPQQRPPAQEKRPSPIQIARTIATSASPTFPASPTGSSFSSRRTSQHSIQKISHASSSSIESIQQTYPVPETSHITLHSKPGANLVYTFYPASPSTKHHINPFANTLVVFLNSLGGSRTAWERTIELVLQTRITSRLPLPAILTYDRYGQGDSGQDPDDLIAPDHMHDCMSAVLVLHHLLHTVWDTNNPRHAENHACELPRLVFVACSIGCALARLFAQTYPGTVAGLLFLDSMMANSDFVSFWPDPDANDFDSRVLPQGVTVEDLRNAREATTRRFHPACGNKEGLSRKSLRDLLPEAGAPMIEGFGGEPPYLTICGHDWEKFANETEQKIHIREQLTMAYLNPTWRAYHNDLCNITTPDRVIGPVNAVGAGHFIHKDQPEFVAGEVNALLDRITRRAEQVRERDGYVWGELGAGDESVG